MKDNKQDELSRQMERIEENTKRYKPLKDFCESAQRMSYTDFETCKDKLISDFIALIENGIEDFNINDIVVDYLAPNRYTTPLQYILFSDVFSFIDETFKRFLDSIIVDIDKLHKEFIYKDILCVLYENIKYGRGRTDSLLPLIYKSENLNFFKKQKSVSEKLLMTNFMIAQKDNYSCSEKFLHKLYENHKLLLAERERFIVSELRLSLEQSLNKLNSNEYPISNELIGVRTKAEDLLLYIKANISEKM